MRAVRVYVASSWRNSKQQVVARVLRQHGHEVYDFRNPPDGDKGFHWSDIDPLWKHWSPNRYREALKHPLAEAGFKRDFDALDWADAVLLVQPCGRSAHLELGWAVGAGKRTCILLDDGEPELMVKMVDVVAINLNEMLDWVNGLRGVGLGRGYDPKRPPRHLSAEEIATRELHKVDNVIAMGGPATAEEVERLQGILTKGLAIPPELMEDSENPLHKYEAEEKARRGGK